MRMKNKMMVGILTVATAVLLANNLELPFGGGYCAVVMRQ
jgi:hypothetical protein